MDPLAQFDWNSTLRPLFTAVVLSGLVGLEREVRRKPAGLRTNILIGVGAALFTAMAESMTGEDAASRIIQGVVTGVGFIGGGVLIRQGGEIQGMTTAATIWLVTGIGVACGLRLYEMAIAVTIIAILVLWGLSPLDKRLHQFKQQGMNAAERYPDD
ncbi:MAG: MgtC/SapB family protein [Planctomycetaceae bacterium]|nr:MgtC/SapB family protein [Planctomycetaceae bacterium]